MTGDDQTFHDLGWLAAPAWLTFSAMELVGVVVDNQAPQNSYLHHLIEVSPSLMAAGIGVLHWWSNKEFRKQRMANDLAIAKLQAASPAPPSHAGRQHGGHDQVVS